MGSADLRSAFNDAAAPYYTASTATMSQKMSGGIQQSILEFKGTDADGQPFEVKSNLIRPGGDVMQVARETAAAIVQQKKDKANATPATPPTPTQ